MDRKSLLAVVLIIGGGMLLSHYSDVFEKETERPLPSFLEEQMIMPTADISLPSSEYSNSFAEIVQIIEPSLVNISAVHIVEVQTPFHHFYFGDPFEDFFNDFFGRSPRRRESEPEVQRRRQEGTGSGFIVGSEGYVLTNYHVIRNADELKVTTHDGKSYEAELVGQDPRTDLAVVRIKSSRSFNALKLGDSDAMRVGDWVMAAGSPFGLNQTFTVGIISALRQDVRVENTNFRNMIQTDAAINRGNSGGPMVNLRGEVVGINSAIFAPTGVFSGIGFAIPINDAKNVLSELIQKGRVVRGWLGVEISDVDEAIKRQFSLDTDKGALVNRVVENSAAYRGGLLRGDVIVEYNEESIEGVRDLQEKVSFTSPGTSVKVVIIRDGERKTLDVVLGELEDESTELSRREREDEPSDPDRPETYEWAGITVSDLTGLIRDRYSTQETEGVIVINIDPSKEGYRIGLRTGDIIRELNRNRIKNISEFTNALSEASLSDGIVLDIIRAGRPLYISYRRAE